jgi:putative N6-adenine-specific DNA methylase
MGQVFERLFNITATTYAGLEATLAAELEELGARDVCPVRRAVTFRGDMQTLYRANFALRTALRILVPVKSFRIANADDLYQQALTIEWEQLFDVSKTFAVHGAIASPLFSNSMFAALRVKDAIVDRFRKAANRRPFVNADSPDVPVHLHIADNLCTVSLDSSGAALYKRGYRTESSLAPISEVMAAGMLRLAGWSGAEPLIDPMCGSGTIAIEAAMLAANILPGETGRPYAFQKWRNYDANIMAAVSRCSHNESPVSIYASDISRGCADLTARNSVKAGVDDIIHIRQADFRLLPRNPKVNFLLSNPPYGERMATNAPDFYAMLGERLKHVWTDSTAWLISTPECFKYIGLKPAAKIPLLNGDIECSFRRFDLYKGSRKPTA